MVGMKPLRESKPTLRKGEWASPEAKALEDASDQEKKRSSPSIGND